MGFTNFGLVQRWGTGHLGYATVQSRRASRALLPASSYELPESAFCYRLLLYTKCGIDPYHQRAIESLDSGYRRLNRARSVLPSDTDVRHSSVTSA